MPTLARSDCWKTFSWTKFLFISCPARAQSARARRELLCILWYLMVFMSFHCIVWYCIISHGIAWYCIVGFGARAVSRKTPIYFMLQSKMGSFYKSLCCSITKYQIRDTFLCQSWTTIPLQKIHPINFLAEFLENNIDLNSNFFRPIWGPMKTPCVEHRWISAFWPRSPRK